MYDDTAVSVQGRFVRLGTASLLSSGGDPSRFIQLESIDMRKYVKRPALAKVYACVDYLCMGHVSYVFGMFYPCQVLCDYALYHEHNPKKALELASEATLSAEYAKYY